MSKRAPSASGRWFRAERRAICGAGVCWERAHATTDVFLCWREADGRFYNSANAQDIRAVINVFR